MGSNLWQIAGLKFLGSETGTLTTDALEVFQLLVKNLKIRLTLTTYLYYSSYTDLTGLFF
jgi:hypothetical protein